MSATLVQEARVGDALPSHAAPDVLRRPNVVVSGILSTTETERGGGTESKTRRESLVIGTGTERGIVGGIREERKIEIEILTAGETIVATTTLDLDETVAENEEVIAQEIDLVTLVETETVGTTSSV